MAGNRRSNLLGNSQRPVGRHWAAWRWLAAWPTLLLTSVISSISSHPVNAEVAPGDILAVVDSAPAGLHRIYQDGPTWVSSVLTPLPQDGDFVEVAISSTGEIFLADQDPEAVYRVSPQDGSLEIVSCLDSGGGELSCSAPVGSGPVMEKITGLAIEADGALVACAQTSGGGTIFRVDPTTGNRTIVSGWDTVSGIVGQGPIWTASTSGSGSRALSDIAVQSDGTILVVAGEDGSADIRDGRIFQVDPATGDRSVLSGPNHGGGLDFRVLSGVDVALDGTIFASATRDSTGVTAVWSVDPSSGDRLIVSSDAIGGGEAMLTVLRHLELDNQDQPLTGPGLSPDFELHRVAPVSGDRSLVLASLNFRSLAVQPQPVGLPGLGLFGVGAMLTLLATIGVLNAPRSQPGVS